MLGSAIAEFFRHKVVGTVIILACWTKPESLYFSKRLIQHGIYVMFSNNTSILDTPDVYSIQGVIYIGDNQDLLYKANKKHFSLRYKWLIVSENLPDILNLSRYDTEITWLLQNTHVSNSSVNSLNEEFKFQDLYFHPRDGISVHPWGIWSKASGLQVRYEKEKILRRYDLKGYTFKIPSAMATFADGYNGTFEEYLADNTHPEKDSAIRCGYAAAALVTETLNATNVAVPVKMWVSLDNSSVLKMLADGKADLGGSPIRILPARLELIDYIMPVWPFRVGFIYLAERVSSSNMFLEPFHVDVWWCSVAIGLILALVLWFASKSPIERDGAIIGSLATYLQQDASTVPDSPSGKFTFILLSVWSMLINAYYTSAIVSALMSAGTGGPTTVTALADSKYAIASEDYSFIRNLMFVKNTNWTGLEYLMKKKMTSKFYQPISTGVEMISQGTTAYHAQLNHVNLLVNRFTDDQICKLSYIDTIPEKRAVRVIYNMGPQESMRERFKQINILTLTSQYIYENLMYVHKNISKFNKISDFHNVNSRHKNNLAVPTTRLHKTPLWIPSSKYSQYKDVMRSAGSWVSETGLVKRQLSQWLIKPTLCRSSMLAERVNFGDVSLLIGVTAFGLMISLWLLAIEIAFFKWSQRKKVNLFDNEGEGISKENNQ